MLCHFRHGFCTLSMTLQSEFVSLLRCPFSGQSLSFDQNMLVSADGQYSYPLVGDIPWLLAQPRNSLLDWGAKLNHFQQVFLQEIAQADRDSKQATGATRERLTRLLDAKRGFLLQITTLLEPLTRTQVAPTAVYDALRDRAPSTQNLLSYEANVYRDWVWGEEENRLTRDFVAEVFPKKPGKLAVLGAGACRLALDLHALIKPDATVATDINPLFLLLVQRLLKGQEVSLNEFPLQPKSSADVAHSHQILGLEKPPENFFLSFADAAKPAFQAAAFDTVFTPWVIDIQPHELSVFLKQLNHYVPVGGYWVNFGSLVFQQKRDALCFSIDEIQDLARQAGFEIEKINEQCIPYLKSPYNAGHRMETVWAWRAKKLENVAAEPDLQTLPSWLLNPEQPIPLHDQFRSLAAQHQYLNSLFSKLDGRTSLASIADTLARKENSGRDEILSMLTQYFEGFYY